MPGPRESGVPLRSAARRQGTVTCTSTEQTDVELSSQTRSTWVGALRGRWHRGPADSNWLGISDIRIDLGMIDIENAKDSQLGPWLQTGIGW